jgi:hypothetical protein
MALHVVDPDEGQLTGPGRRLGEGVPHQQRPHQTGPGVAATPSRSSGWTPASVRALWVSPDRLDMARAATSGTTPPKRECKVDLRGEHVGESLLAPDHGDRGLVTGLVSKARIIGFISDSPETRRFGPVDVVDPHDQGVVVAVVAGRTPTGARPSRPYKARAASLSSAPRGSGVGPRIDRRPMRETRSRWPIPRPRSSGSTRRLVTCASSPTTITPPNPTSSAVFGDRGRPALGRHLVAEDLLRPGRGWWAARGPAPHGRDVVRHEGRITLTPVPTAPPVAASPS